jgi:hypothetical protein
VSGTVPAPPHGSYAYSSSAYSHARFRRARDLATTPATTTATTTAATAHGSHPGSATASVGPPAAGDVAPVAGVTAVADAVGVGVAT